ncbi:MAG: amidohydrolase family protein [Clostridia bacterium]|nr:amidohydrolase family protein [Clostridia bacterium]
MYKIFDIHTHIYPDSVAKKAVDSLSAFYEFDKLYHFLPSGKGTFDDLYASCIKYNICGCLMLCVATNAKQVEHVNDFMANIVKSNTSPSFTPVGFGGIHQDYPDLAKEAERIVSIGLKGVKIHPDIQRVNIDDKRLMPLYEAIEGKLPLYLHMGDDRDDFQFSATERLVKIKKRFPNLEVVAAHLGGYTAWHKIGLLTDFDKIWFDASSSLWVIDSTYAKSVIEELGTKRVMFGTDYPVAYANEELERFMKVELDEEARQDILYNNAARFLGL